MAKDDVHNKAYDFLHPHAENGSSFDPADLRAVTGWAPGSWKTYKSKQLKSYLEKDGKLFKVKAAFARMTKAEFHQLFTQVRTPVTEWKRATYDHVVTYEFLLPLTRENKLRSSLDDLFYRDTLEQRTSELEVSDLQDVMPLQAGETDVAYRKRVVDQLADLIGGYSITHVDGRFRVGGVVSRTEAARMLVERKRYLIDETTAVVRFILPCPGSRSEHGDVFDHSQQAPERDVTDEILLIRTLFFLYFVEAVAASIEGEDVIWLLESSRLGGRLYALEKTTT